MPDPKNEAGSPKQQQPKGDPGAGAPKQQPSGDSSASPPDAKYSREGTGPQLGEAPRAEEVHAALDLEKTVRMIFPRPVNLQDRGIMHRFAAGVHEVPESLADHFYLKHCGVERAK